MSAQMNRTTENGTDAMDFRAGSLGSPQKPMEPDAYRPIIGIPIPVRQDAQGPLLLTDAMGAWSVERTRGRVFLIPLWPFPTHKNVFQSLWPLMQSMDGLLLPAGAPGMDWYTFWLKRESNPGPHVWPIAWEMALSQLATSLHMPILAIGDGAERWNVALGGKAQQRLEGYQEASISPDNWQRPLVRIRTESKLAAWIHPALAEAEIQHPWTPASLPHQGMEKLAPGLMSCAQNDQGRIVAYERKDAPFGLGILPRIDWGLDQDYGTVIFEAFMQSCRSFAKERQQTNDGWEATRDAVCMMVEERVSHNKPLLSIYTSAAPTLVSKTQTTHPDDSRAEQSGHSGKSHYRMRSQPSLPELRSLKKQRLKAAAR